MHVAEIWRYPIKSMRGEPIGDAVVRRDGIEGDLLLHVENETGRLITARTAPDQLALHSFTGKDGPLLNSAAWQSVRASSPRAADHVFDSVSQPVGDPPSARCCADESDGA